MYSPHSKYTKFIAGSFYNIAPLPGSVQFVLTSPDTVIAPQILPTAKIFARPFLHEELVQSGQNRSVEQHSTFYIQPPNLGSIGQLLHKALGAPTCSLFGQARDYRNPCCNTNNRRIPPIPSSQNPLRDLSTIFPHSLGLSPLFCHLQIQK